MAVQGELTVNRHSAAFVAYFVVLCADAVINRFVALPLHLVLLPLFLLQTALSPLSTRKLAALLVITALAAKGTLYPFSAYDLGYALAVMMAVSLFLVERTKLQAIASKVTHRHVLLCFAIASALYWVYLLGVDFNPVDVDLDAMGADPEYYRMYHSGLFRAPHFPAYLFYFLGLAIFAYRREIGRAYLPLLGACAAAVITAGSRTPIIAFVVSLGLLFVGRGVKGKVILAALAVVAAVVVLNVDPLMALSENTIFYQYVSFIHTAVNNTDRLSRLQLLSSFQEAVQDFSPLEVLVGRSFTGQMLHNERTFGHAIWFHNDLLGSFYSYGAVGLACLCGAYFSFYRKYVRPSGSDVSKVYFLSIGFMAIFNGIVYHPLFMFMQLLFGLTLREARG